MKSYIPVLLSFLVTTSAIPTSLDKRQNLNAAAYNAVPVVADAAAPMGDAPAASFSYSPSSAASAAAAAATESVTVIAASQPVSSPTPIPISDVCQPRSPGAGPTVSNPDTADAFTSFAQFSSDATNAQVPLGYTRILTASNSAAQDSTYMMYQLFSSYDTAGCAALCTSNRGCNSFNIYYERGASLKPGPGCDNPPSTTYIKCVVFGGILTTTSAKNIGGFDDQFQVVIAGSSIFTLIAPQAIPGFLGPYSFGNATINAPSGYLGVQVFPQTQPYDASVCAAACNQKTNYDIAQGLPNKQNPDVCNFFNAYILYKNGENGVFTCTYYTSAWDSSYATQTGQYDSSGNHYTIGSSFGYALPSAPKNGKTTIALQLVGAGDAKEGTYLYQPGTNNLAVGSTTPYQFTLSATGQLLADPTGSTGPASITARGGIGSYGVFFGKNFQALTCSVSDGFLNCSVGMRNIFEYCPNTGNLGITNILDGGCVKVSLKVS